MRAFPQSFAGPAAWRLSSQRSPFPSALPSNRTIDAVETIHFLKKSGKQVAFVTNNATKSRKEYLKKVSGPPFPRNGAGKTPVYRLLTSVLLYDLKVPGFRLRCRVGGDLHVRFGGGRVRPRRRVALDRRRNETQHLPDWTESDGRRTRLGGFNLDGRDRPGRRRPPPSSRFLLDPVRPEYRDRTVLVPDADQLQATHQGVQLPRFEPGVSTRPHQRRPVDALARRRLRPGRRRDRLGLVWRLAARAETDRRRETVPTFARRD